MDLVLQGTMNNYTIEIANHYLDLDFVNNIIISCWDIDKHNVENLNNKIKIIYNNNEVKNSGITNRNRQIITSINGLKNVSTKFSVKLRSDQKISLESMILMYKYYEKNKERDLHYENNFNKPLNKICVAGIFKAFPFHPRDHIFWGNTEDLIDLFSLPLDELLMSGNPLSNEEYKKYTRSELYIAIHYCKYFNNKINLFIENYKEYLVDDAPKINEAFELSEKILNKIFLPFPKINFEWPKHGLKEYHYHLTEGPEYKEVFGEL
jgi:hypothetical protein